MLVARHNCSASKARDNDLASDYFVRALKADPDNPVLIERVFLRGAEDFAMLEPYARGFGDCSGIAKALETNGLEVTFRRHFFGCATSVCGRKPN